MNRNGMKMTVQEVERIS